MSVRSTGSRLGSAACHGFSSGRITSRYDAINWSNPTAISYINNFNSIFFNEKCNFHYFTTTYLDLYFIRIFNENCLLFASKRVGDLQSSVERRHLAIFEYSGRNRGANGIAEWDRGVELIISNAEVGGRESRHIVGIRCVVCRPV